MDNTEVIPLYSAYYQAYVQKELCWFVTATLRSYEHLAFDRTLNPEKNQFEFFVSPSLEQYFLELMAHYEKEGLVTGLQKLPNRLVNLTEQI